MNGLDTLIQYLLDENPQYSDVQIPEDLQGKRDLFRALRNIRPPLPLSEEFLRLQDEELQTQLQEKGIVELPQLPTLNPKLSTTLNSKPTTLNYILWQGDITRLRADAIVNAANSQMLGCFQPLHSCIDNIIHTKAGIGLRLECARIMAEQGHPEPTGQAKITPAFDLPCRYVLHTVGPIVQGRLTREHEDLLRSSYLSCLKLAAEKGLKSIAFCCISTGVFMFPNERAAEIAVETVRAWLDETGSDMKVIFNVFKDVDLEIYERILG